MVPVRLAYKLPIDFRGPVDLVADLKPPPATELLNAPVIVGNLHHSDFPGAHLGSNRSEQRFESVLPNLQRLSDCGDAPRDLTNLTRFVPNVSLVELFR